MVSTGFWRDFREESTALVNGQVEEVSARQLGDRILGALSEQLVECSAVSKGRVVWSWERLQFGAGLTCHVLEKPRHENSEARGQANNSNVSCLYL